MRKVVIRIKKVLFLDAIASLFNIISLMTPTEFTVPSFFYKDDYIHIIDSYIYFVRCIFSRIFII